MNKNDDADKIELIKVQNDNENKNKNKESTVIKKTRPRTYRKSKKLIKENQDFLNSLKTGLDLRHFFHM